MIGKRLEFEMYLMNQYVNTPLLDKVDHFTELPDDVNEWVLFDLKKNLEYYGKTLIQRTVQR